MTYLWRCMNLQHLIFPMCAAVGAGPPYYTDHDIAGLSGHQNTESSWKILVIFMTFLTIIKLPKWLGWRTSLTDFIQRVSDLSELLNSTRVCQRTLTPSFLEWNTLTFGVALCGVETICIGKCHCDPTLDHFLLEMYIPLGQRFRFWVHKWIEVSDLKSPGNSRFLEDENLPQPIVQNVSLILLNISEIAQVAF